MKPHRIAAGAIVFRKERVLLVRYRDGNGGSYLVAPGGATEENESLGAAAVRETEEETGVMVEPGHVIAVEDLLCSKFKMCKVWLSCRYVSGNVRKTKAATAEGIVASGWFTLDDLETETVYPALLKEVAWATLASADWPARLFPIRVASF